MRYGSVCSGIEAASVAWEYFGWSPAWFAEIEPFPSAVLAHHWPHVDNLGDMTTIRDRVTSREIEAPEILVGGTPCQAFSVAGLRGSMGDARGQLTLEFVRLANAIDNIRDADGLDKSIVVWENVPGVLNTKDNAFGCFLGALAGEDCELQPAGKKWTNAGCVYGPERAIAWRVMDAQYFGVAQRRKRVFVVASARDRFDPAKLLFESEGVRRDIAPSREAGEGFTHDIAPSLVSSGRGVERIGETRGQDPVVAVGYRMVAFGEYSDDETAPTMKARDYKDATDLAVVHGTQDPCVQSDIAFSLGRNNGQENALLSLGLAVRRLTPTECERLQGFPDGHTKIPDWYICGCDHQFNESLGKYGCPNCQGEMVAKLKSASDGHRYRALGNSMAVPVMRWIGRRIEGYINA